MKQEDKIVKIDMTLFLFGFEILEYLWNSRNYSYDDRLNEINIKRILPGVKKSEILDAIDNCLFLRNLPQVYKTILCKFVKAVFIDNECKPIINKQFSLKVLEVKEFRYAKNRNKHLLQKALFNNYISCEKEKCALSKSSISDISRKIIDGKTKKYAPICC